MNTSSITSPRFLFLLLTVSIISFSSCRKDKKLADQVVGNYTGVGTDANDMPFINEVMKVSKVSNNTVKIESSGHSNIATITVELIKVDDNIVSSPDDANEVVFAVSDEPVAIALEGENGETFTGEK